MTNRICQVEIRERSPNPAQCELWVCIVPERQSPTTEVIGRFSGPRCRYATTVEVAYPLRPFPKVPDGLPGIARRVVIPEPSFWEPECPFLYDATIELWDDGRQVDRVQFRRGLRSIQLSGSGLRINGRSVALHGRATAQLDDGQANELRTQGTNLLVVPASPQNAAIWDTADERGFLVLGSLNMRPNCLALARSLQEHASTLGWLIDQEFAEQAIYREKLATFRREAPQIRIGIRLKSVLPASALAGVQFVACAEELFPQLISVELPKLWWRSMTGDRANGSADVADAVLGWVQE